MPVRVTIGEVGIVEINTVRLTIRPFEFSDWQDLHEYLSQDSVVEFEPYGIFTASESKEEARKRSNTPSFWAVCLRETGKLIGNVYLNEQDFNTWELGFVFNEYYRNQGYATEAASAIIDWAISTRGARRIVAMCNPRNEPSWRLLERLGLRREGHFIKNIYFKKDEAGNPIWQDTFAYALLATERNK